MPDLRGKHIYKDLLMTDSALHVVLGVTAGGTLSVMCTVVGHLRRLLSVLMFDFNCAVN